LENTPPGYQLISFRGKNKKGEEEKRGTFKRKLKKGKEKRERKRENRKHKG
jgi:hypothetical protein